MNIAEYYLISCMQICPVCTGLQYTIHWSKGFSINMQHKICSHLCLISDLQMISESLFIYLFIVINCGNKKWYQMFWGLDASFHEQSTLLNHCSVYKQTFTAQSCSSEGICGTNYPEPKQGEGPSETRNKMSAVFNFCI